MPVRVEGYACSLFADRDRAVLPQLTFRGKVRWFELRIRRMLIRPLDVLRPTRRGRYEADISFLLVFGTVLFNGVEALGSFYKGRDGSGQTFRDFVTDFMNPTYHRHISEMRDDFRNGLAHGLAIKNGGFEFLSRTPARVDPRQGVQIDPDVLFRDFKRAVRTYLSRVRRAGPTSPLGQAFLRRFNQVFGVQPCPTSPPQP